MWSVARLRRQYEKAEGEKQVWRDDVGLQNVDFVELITWGYDILQTPLWPAGI
jgi:hypothetical protein